MCLALLGEVVVVVVGMVGMVGVVVVSGLWSGPRGLGGVSVHVSRILLADA